MLSRIVYYKWMNEWIRGTCTPIFVRVEGGGGCMLWTLILNHTCHFLHILIMKVVMISRACVPRSFEQDLHLFWNIRNNVSQFSVDTCLPQIYKGDPRPRIPPCVMTSSVVGLKMGSSFFCQLHTQNKCVHNLCTLCCILHMFIFTLRLQ